MREKIIFSCFFSGFLRIHESGASYTIIVFTKLLGWWVERRKLRCECGGGGGGCLRDLRDSRACVLVQVRLAHRFALAGITMALGRDTFSGNAGAGCEGKGDDGCLFEKRRLATPLLATAVRRVVCEGYEVLVEVCGQDVHVEVEGEEEEGFEAVEFADCQAPDFGVCVWGFVLFVCVC